MKNIIPKDTRYIPFTQQYSCCVPTSISMIMYKLGIPLIPQELLGYYLGLIIDKQNKHLFWNMRTGKRPKTGYGTQTSKKQFNANDVFKKLKIPLTLTKFPIQNFKNTNTITSFLEDKIKKNKHILVLLRSSVLNNTKTKNGHACVVDRIYSKRNIVRIIDPSVNQVKWREIKIEKFIKAIKMHPTNNGGFWELIKTHSKF